MLEVIQQKLKELERHHNIIILYACESGSRAWGFPSPDSDYDVRFIYVRSRQCYLSIADTNDVIDLPVSDVLDIGGWDLKKALKLFLKSNSPLYEWLQSPIIYKNDYNFREEMEALMSKYYSLRAGGNHYLSMAINKMDNDMQDTHVKIKSYFYALRSALSCKWIADNQTVPPMQFHELRTLVNNNKELNQSLDGLLQRKLKADEKTLIDPIANVNDWINDTISKCKEKVPLLPPCHHSQEELDEIFRKYLYEL